MREESWILIKIFQAKLIKLAKYVQVSKVYDALFKEQWDYSLLK